MAFQRTISAALDAHLASDALTLAVCVKVTRVDGTVFGFTSCDQDLVISGVTYEALSSVSASVLRQELAGTVDNLDISGMLQSSRITETDLEAGLYDQAAVEWFWCNWNDLTQGILKLVSGTIGNVTITDGQYIAEIRSLSQRLQQQIGELYSPLCRVCQLFDARCSPAGNTTPTATPASFRFSRTVTVVTSQQQVTFGSDTHATGYYDYGRVLWLSGLNAGLAREIKTHIGTGSAAQLTLHEALPFAIQVGDTATLEAGCDRRIDTCRSRFSNSINFRGEPELPGIDQVMQQGRKS